MKSKSIIILLSVYFITACTATGGGGSNTGGGSAELSYFLGFSSRFTGEYDLNLAIDPMPGIDKNTGFRIPAMIVLKNGTVIVAGDLRGATIKDTPNNVDIFIRRSTDNGNNWSDGVIAHRWDDYEMDTSSTHSAGMADSSLIEGPSGDVFNIVTGFPALAGIWNGTDHPVISPFLDIGNKRYLVLIRSSEQPFKPNYSQDAPPRAFTNIVLIATNKTGGGRVYAFENSETGRSPIRKYDIATKTVGEPIDGNWELDKYYELFKNGEKHEIFQSTTTGATPSPGQPGDTFLTTKVHANVMFKNSPFRAPRSSYVQMSKSTDDGIKWSKTRDISWQFRPSAGDGVFDTTGGRPTDGTVPALAKQQYIVSPGKGLLLTKEPHKGRMLTSVYDILFIASGGAGGERAYAIYSDDNGQTWFLSENSAAIHPGSSRFSETQYVEAPDGKVLAFGRGAAFIGLAQSDNGGKTWGSSSQTTPFQDGNTRNGTMISATTLQHTISFEDDRPLVALSHPDMYLADGTTDDTLQRFNGKIRILDLYNDGGLWKIDIVDENVRTIFVGNNSADAASKKFGYAVVVELTNGNIALFAENTSPAGDANKGSIGYMEIRLNRIAVEQ